MPILSIKVLFQWFLCLMFNSLLEIRVWADEKQQQQQQQQQHQGSNGQIKKKLFFVHQLLYFLLQVFLISQLLSCCFLLFVLFFFLTFHTKSCLVLLRVLWFNYCLLVFPIEMSRIQISPLLIIEFSKKKNHGFNFFTKPTH